MIDQLIETIKEVESRSAEIFPVYARMYKSAFDALISEGFTPDQALKLLLEGLKFTG